MSNVCHYIGGCQNDPSKANTGQCTGCTCAKALSSLQCSYQDTCPEGQYSPSASLIDSCAGNLLTPYNNPLTYLTLFLLPLTSASLIDSYAGNLLTPYNIQFSL